MKIQEFRKLIREEVRKVMSEAKSKINMFSYEPGAQFGYDEHKQVSLHQVFAELKRINKDLPNEMDIYIYKDPNYKYSYVVVDLDEGGLVYSLLGGRASYMHKITKEALRTSAIYSNRNGKGNINAALDKVQKALGL